MKEILILFTLLFSLCGSSVIKNLEENRLSKTPTPHTNLWISLSISTKLFSLPGSFAKPNLKEKKMVLITICIRYEITLSFRMLSSMLPLIFYLINVLLDSLQLTYCLA